MNQYSEKVLNRSINIENNQSSQLQSRWNSTPVWSSAPRLAPQDCVETCRDVTSTLLAACRRPHRAFSCNQLPDCRFRGWVRWSTSGVKHWWLEEVARKIIVKDSLLLKPRSPCFFLFIANGTFGFSAAFTAVWWMCEWYITVYIYMEREKDRERDLCRCCSLFETAALHYLFLALILKCNSAAWT